MFHINPNKNQKEREKVTKTAWLKAYLLISLERIIVKFEKSNIFLFKDLSLN